MLNPEKKESKRQRSQSNVASQKMKGDVRGKIKGHGEEGENGVLESGGSWFETAANGRGISERKKRVVAKQKLLIQMGEALVCYREK